MTRQLTQEELEMCRLCKKEKGVKLLSKRKRPDGTVAERRACEKCYSLAWLKRSAKRRAKNGGKKKAKKGWTSGGYTPHKIKSKIHDCACGRKYIATRDNQDNCLCCIRDAIHERRYAESQ